MAKKKTAVQETPVVDDGYRYQATFCPTWRTEVNCGEHESLDAARFAIGVEAEGFNKGGLLLEWDNIDDANWTASGWDGEVETNLTIAKITRVAAE